MGPDAMILVFWMLSFKPTLLFPFHQGILISLHLRNSKGFRNFAWDRDEDQKYISYYESQAEIKISRSNINNLRYADDTTLMAESEEELKSPLIKVKEESEKAGIKLSI